MKTIREIYKIINAHESLDVNSMTLIKGGAEEDKHRNCSVPTTTTTTSTTTVCATTSTTTATDTTRKKP